MEPTKIKRRVYDREFKVEAVQLAVSNGHTIKEVARNLGISDSNLRRWIRAYRKDARSAFPGQGHLPPEQEELHRLQRENTRLCQERDILKKYLALFSTPP